MVAGHGEKEEINDLACSMIDVIKGLSDLGNNRAKKEASMQQILDFDVDTTLGALARDYPVLIPFFSEKGLDYCCGGNISIAQVCAANHWSVETFTAELTHNLQQGGQEPVPTWAPGSEVALIDYILKRFHEGHRLDFKRAQGLMEKVVRVHGHKYPPFLDLAELLNALVEDIEPHMLKEERVLFPLILEKLGQTETVAGGCPVLSPHGPIRVMLMEHDQVGRLLEMLAERSGQFIPPDWACTTVIGLYELLKKLHQEIHLHVHLENNVLFPMVLALDW